MNTITIDSNIYKGAEMYAKLHNISIESVIEKGMTHFLGKLIPQAAKEEKQSLDEVLALMDTMMISGGDVVPTEENAMETLVDSKYKL